MSISVAVQLFATAALFAIVYSDDNLVTWPVSDLSKHLCDEKAKIVVKDYSTFDCTVSYDVLENAFEVSFTAVAVQISTILGDSFLDRDATAYAVIFDDYQIQVYPKPRLGGAKEDLEWKMINKYFSDTEDPLSFGTRLLLLLKQNDTAPNTTCVKSQKTIEFKEGGTYKLTWIPEESRSFKVGFGYNTVWLGCPQPICLDGSVDAVMVKHEDLFVVRGTYVWDIRKDAPEQENAWAISQVEIKINRDTQKITPLYFDAGYYNDAFILISMGVFYTADSKEGLYKETVNVPGLDGVEAAFINKGQLILISNEGKQGTKCMRTISDANFTTQQNPPQIKDCPKLDNDELSKSNINAMFVLNDELYVMKGWKYANLGNVDAFVTNKGAVKIENWEYSFLKVLGCDTNGYKKWGRTYGFKYYREYLDIHFDRPRSNVASAHSIAIVDLVVLIVLEVIVVLLAFIYWNKYHKESEIGLLSMMSAYRKGGRQGVGARFKRKKMTTEKLKESKGSQLDVRRSKMSQLDVLDLPESMIGGTKKKASEGQGGSAKPGGSKAKKSKSSSKLNKPSSKVASKSSKKASK